MIRLIDLDVVLRLQIFQRILLDLDGFLRKISDDGLVAEECSQFVDDRSRRLRRDDQHVELQRAVWSTLFEIAPRVGYVFGGNGCAGQTAERSPQLAAAHVSTLIEHYLLDVIVGSQTPKSVRDTTSSLRFSCSPERTQKSSDQNVTRTPNCA